MRIEEELTLRRLPQSSDSDAPRSELMLQGAPTEKIVEGATLEAAVAVGTFHLIFTTDDCPFEEMLRIILLDSAFNMLDSALVGGPYATGSFSSLTLKEPDTVLFHFIGDTTWSVQLLPRATFRWPFVSEPFGVWRSFSFSRRFVVCGAPLPQSA